MISLPAEFNVIAFASEIFSIAAPFIGVTFIFAVGCLILNILYSVGKRSL